MVRIETARRVVAKLTAEDMRRLRRRLDDCLSAAIEFDETEKPEHFIGMKRSIEDFIETLNELENHPNTR